MSKIYCVYCGLENKNTDEICKKCHKSLNPKDHPWRDYLYNHIKSDLKGKTEDKILDIIKNFILSHLYGTILTISVIFTVTTGIITYTNKIPNYIEKTTISYLDKKDNIISLLDDYKNNNYYLNGNVIDEYYNSKNKSLTNANSDGLLSMLLYDFSGDGIDEILTLAIENNDLVAKLMTIENNELFEVTKTIITKDWNRLCDTIKYQAFLKKKDDKTYLYITWDGAKTYSQMAMDRGFYQYTITNDSIKRSINCDVIPNNKECTNYVSIANELGFNIEYIGESILEYNEGEIIEVFTINREYNDSFISKYSNLGQVKNNESFKYGTTTYTDKINSSNYKVHFK